MDCSTHLGTGKAIAVVHPIIAGELLDQIAERKHTTVSEIALDLLRSPLLENKGKSFSLTQLHYDANRMLKHRKKREYGDDVQTKFAPLIEKILYVKDTEDGQQKPTEESIDQAAQVLREGLEKFEDPMLAQQMARVFYVNAKTFCESKIDSCFDMALKFCDQAIEMSPNNSFLFDTKGRIYDNKIKALYSSIREDNRSIEIDTATPVLPLAFDAMKWFRKSLAASVDYQNTYGFHGEVSVIFYLLDVLRCVTIFRDQKGKKRLQEYLDFYQVIPAEVKTTWSEFHELIKELRNRCNHCIEGLAEDFTIFKGNSAAEKILPNQIALFKAQYLSYFGEGNEGEGEAPMERWLYRWRKINEYLAGDIFSSVFKIGRGETKQESTPRDTLQLLQKLAHKNYRESVDSERYKDILLIISTTLALHSPCGTSRKREPAKLSEEYREIYKFVEKLFALEECDEVSKRLYAHLFKVMFLWPRKELELSSYCVKDFYDSLKKLKERWERKCKGHFDQDKVLKQKMFKHMSFKKKTRQYTTLFYLGKGSGLDVFVHINELSDKRSLDWQSPQVKNRLRRLTGMVESKNIIRMENPLESSKTIEIYYSPFREGGFSKQEVSFYLGFSWPQPIALGVKYTNTEHVKHPVEFIGPVGDGQMKFFSPKYNVITYEEYTSSMAKVTKKLAEIEKLKEMKESGVELDENQKKKLKKEVEIKDNLQELKKSLDALVALEEDFFD